MTRIALKIRSENILHNHKKSVSLCGAFSRTVSVFFCHTTNHPTNFGLALNQPLFNYSFCRSPIWVGLNRAVLVTARFTQHLQSALGVSSVPASQGWYGEQNNDPPPQCWIRTRVLKSVRGSQKRRSEWSELRETPTAVAGFGDKRRDYKPRNEGSL